ncbi:hypothetical protein EDB85DRAFT_1384530 [Lactarius pseudohatsudake]|nr:hypothetical protein EDB85DRAFT_1384530 [Lactarius pseudohatsudake]
MHDGSGLSGLTSRVLVYGWDYEWDWDLHTSIRAVPRPGRPGRPPPLSKHPPTFPPAKSSTKARGGRRFTVQHAPTPPSLPLVDASKTRVIGRMLIVINNTCSPPLQSLSPPPPHLLPPIIDVHAAPHGDSGACSATVEELTVLPLKSIPQASPAISTCPRPASRTSSPDPPSLVFTPILLRWPKATDLRHSACGNRTAPLRASAAPCPFHLQRDPDPARISVRTSHTLPPWSLTNAHGITPAWTTSSRSTRAERGLDVQDGPPQWVVLQRR